MVAIASQSEHTLPRSATRPFLGASKFTFLVGALLLVVVTMALYYPVTKHPFFDPDDSVYVTKNLHVQEGLTASTIWWAFRSHSTNWHPLTWLSHALDAQLFGLNPAGHHEMNVVFHALNAVLLFWVLKQATGYSGRSFMVAALFALHPINVEAVAWVAERKTMLSTTFFLLAFVAYRWYVLKPHAQRYLVVASLFVLGLLAKPQVIMLPLLLLLWDYWPLGRMFPPVVPGLSGTTSSPISPPRTFVYLFWEKVPLFALAGLDALATMHAQGVGPHKYWPFPLSVRLENAIISYVRYIGKAFWPAWLAPFYPHPGNSLSALQIAGALALLLLITALVIAARQRRYLVVGWLWFLISLLPMIGLIQVGKQGMADRYAYQPFLGLFIMVCWQIAEWSTDWRLPAAVMLAISIAILIMLSLITSRQINYWKGDQAIWSHTLQVTKDNWVALYKTGAAFYEQGQVSEAQPYFLRAYQLAPSDPDANIALGILEHQRGNFSQAIEYYKVAVNSPECQPEAKLQALANMGHAYERLGDPADAQKSFQAAEKLQSELTPASN